MVVLVMVTLMAGFAVISFNTARNQLFLVTGYSQHLQALVLAKAGVNLARAGLTLDKNDSDDLEEDWNTMAQASQLMPIALGNGYVSINIVDEERKRNINMMGEEELLEYFKSLELKSVKKGDILDIDIVDDTIYSELRDSFLDWIDPDDNDRKEGAESGWYKRQSFVYQGEKIEYFPHNHPIASVGELLWIRGFDANMVFGRKGNPRLVDILTVYGTGKLNANTVSDEVLKAMLKNEDEYGWQYLFDAIMENRPYENVSEFKSILSQYGGNTLADEIAPHFKVKSEYFRITATGIVGQTESVVEAVVKRNGDTCDILLWQEKRAGETGTPVIQEETVES
jgi:type II secretory pathway component PulK